MYGFETYEADEFYDHLTEERLRELEELRRELIRLGMRPIDAIRETGGFAA